MERLLHCSAAEFCMYAMPLKLIFHNTDKGVIGRRESYLYNLRVTIEYNKKAYNNKDLMLK